MLIGVKTWIVSIKLKNIPFLKYIVVLFAWVVSSSIFGISSYKALNYFFSANETFAILVLNMISGNTVSAYKLRTKC